MELYPELRQELFNALDRHIDILRDVELIENESLDGVVFMMRSFGFIFDRAPMVLSGSDELEMNYMMFQYYSLLTELKYNLALNYPYAKLQGRPIIEIVEEFPTTYEKEMKQWWEQHTGLDVQETKQTIEIKDFEY
ncbi:hypothetical protein [Enterococcus sp. HY326]|uniref:hypothetical protein n=1 Tax=Enterococcus sp. HY326 TaxID=2971265 RepID=UPI00223EA329|nr:hypothetical protein [Enterococcus sp. HY326]